MNSNVWFLVVLLAMISLFGYLVEDQEKSFPNEGGISIGAHPWENNVHIFSGGDTLHLSLSGKTDWSGDDLWVRIPPGETVSINASLKQRRVSGWIGNKNFWSIDARVVVSKSGYECNTALSDHSGKGMDLWIVGARNLFNGTIDSGSVIGDFRGEIIAVPR